MIMFLYMALWSCSSIWCYDHVPLYGAMVMFLYMALWSCSSIWHYGHVPLYGAMEMFLHMALCSCSSTPGVKLHQCFILKLLCNTYAVPLASEANPQRGVDGDILLDHMSVTHYFNLRLKYIRQRS